MSGYFQILLFLCSNQIYICEFSKPSTAVNYHELGLSCYVNGVFHQTCPTPEWKQKVIPKGKPWE